MPFCLLLFDFELKLFEHLFYTFSAMYFITIEPLHCYITQSIQMLLIHMFDILQYGLYLWRFLTKFVVVHQSH